MTAPPGPPAVFNWQRFEFFLTIWFSPGVGDELPCDQKGVLFIVLFGVLIAEFGRIEGFRNEKL